MGMQTMPGPNDAPENDGQAPHGGGGSELSAVSRPTWSRDDGRGLVVSVHDVSPLTWQRVDVMLRDLAEWGVERTSLLVVPDHHRRGRFVDDALFCEWLGRSVADGHEAVVHGYFHLRDAKSGDSWGKRLTTERYTAGEGEFFDLSEAEARERAGLGLAEFRRIGLAPRGFVAPAWLLGAEAEVGVRRAGFRYTTRIGTISDFERGRCHASQSLVWSVRAGWRRVVSLAWNETLLTALGDRPLVRIGLHPPDWDFPAIREHARRCVVRALAGRAAMTYDGWLDLQSGRLQP